jgi:glutathione S-transferase
MAITLWQLQVSHYAEKARWALDVKGVEYHQRDAFPGLHPLTALAVTRGRARTIPVLEIDGERVAESSAIIARLEEEFPDPPLYPEDPDERRRALQIERFFDEEVGHTLRRVLFTEIVRDPDALREVASASPLVWKPAASAASLAARASVRLLYGISGGRDTSDDREGVVRALDRIESELGDGDHLVGDRFTVADLTAAALLYPLVLPEEGPWRPTHIADGAAEFRESLSDRRAYQWVGETYARHRR